MSANPVPLLVLVEAAPGAMWLTASKVSPWDSGTHCWLAQGVPWDLRPEARVGTEERLSSLGLWPMAVAVAVDRHPGTDVTEVPVEAQQ